MTVPTHAARPPRIDAEQPPVAKLIASLGSPTPSNEAMAAARDALAPARDQPGGLRRIGALLTTALSPWPAPEADEDALSLGAAWLLDALAQRPAWAVEQALRSMYLTATFRPRPAEILEAVDTRLAPLRLALARAERIKATPQPRPDELSPEEAERRRRFTAQLMGSWAEAHRVRPADLAAHERARRDAEGGG